MTSLDAFDLQALLSTAKNNGCKIAILEASSQGLDQHRFEGVDFDVAVLTNIPHDHLDYHGTMEEYAEVKGRLFACQPKYIVLNRDDAWFDYFDKFVAGSQKITYGKLPDSEAHIDKVKLYRKGTEVTVTIDHQTRLELATNLPGEFNAYNMTAAVAAAYLLGVKLNDIVEGVANLEVVPGRFERVVEGLPYDVIVDYAHTPDGLEKLLQAARAITKNRVILVFGACGDRDKAKRPVMGGIAACLADRIFLTDEESYNEDPKAIREMIYKGIEDARGGAMKTTEVADRREAIEKALSIATKGDTVLITGMGHEVYRIINGEKKPWNDSDVVREILNDKR